MKENAFTNFINDFKTWRNDVKKSDKKAKMVIPNLLTASRILAPFCILPATLSGNFTLATFFAATFALTDAFDGKLARHWKTTSKFGENLDPIVDKFFVLGITLPFLNNPIMIVTLILEGIIGTVNLKSAFKNNKPKSTLLGKGKTVLLSLFISLSYLLKMKGIPFESLIPLAITTNVVQLAAAIDYMHIDNKKDIYKDHEKNTSFLETPRKEDKQNSKRKKDIIEYKHLKESLEAEKEIKQEIMKQEEIKRRHFKL